MGSFLTLMMDALLNKEPKEIDRNNCVCCGTLRVADPETKSDAEESDGDEDTVCG